MNAGKVAIVIGAYNEAKNVAGVIRDVKAAGYPWVVVVDDGSEDTTFEVAKAAGADTLRHLINRGQGAALRTGIHYALEHHAEAIVTYDADGQFLASDIKKVLQPIKDDTRDVALGSRFLGHARNISTGKKLVLKLGAFVTYVFSGVKLTDSHNGFRALNRKAAKRIQLTFDRMEHASEFIEEIAKHKLRYTEVPVTVVYHVQGQHPLRSIKMGFKLIAKKVFGW